MEQNKFERRHSLADEGPLSPAHFHGYYLQLCCGLLMRKLAISCNNHLVSVSLPPPPSSLPLPLSGSIDVEVQTLRACDRQTRSITEYCPATCLFAYTKCVCRRPLGTIKATSPAPHRLSVRFRCESDCPIYLIIVGC